jgi:hypothetical protein
MRQLVLIAAMLVVAIPVAPNGQERPGAREAPAWLEQATKAEAEMRFEVAAALLSQVLVEQPRSADAWRARVPLARLLALRGEVAAALLQCQALRDQLPLDHPARRQALELATLLGRRLRAGQTPAYFAGVVPTGTRGIPALDQPVAIMVDPAGRYLLVDTGQGRAYLATGETASAIGGVLDVSAGALLPDGTVALAGKNGLAIAGGKPAFLTSTVGGRPRPLKKVRSLAATSGGDLLVVDRDVDALLRCKAGTLTCAPWGPPGKVLAVKVGVSDFVYVLDDRQQSVRVIDPAGRVLATAGPQVGATRFDAILDLAVDAAYGVYLLDKKKLIHILLLRGDAGRPMTLEPLPTFVLPTDEPRLLKNPLALAAMPDGAVLVVGGASARFLRLQ